MKRFRSFVNSLKKDMSRITSIRENGMQNQMQDKANICIQQFQSAFTSETDDDLPSKSVSLFPAMGDIIVDPVWVAILFCKLNIHKASGPDGLIARVLKEFSSEIAPVLACIFSE